MVSGLVKHEQALLLILDGADADVVVNGGAHSKFFFFLLINNDHLVFAFVRLCLELRGLRAKGLGLRTNDCTLLLLREHVSRFLK